MSNSSHLRAKGRGSSGDSAFWSAVPVSAALIPNYHENTLMCSLDQSLVPDPIVGPYWQISRRRQDGTEWTLLDSAPVSSSILVYDFGEGDYIQFVIKYRYGGGLGLAVLGTVWSDEITPE